MLSLLATHTDRSLFDYAVQSKVYPSEPTVAYVTARGDCGDGSGCSAQGPTKRSPGAAISALHLLKEPPYVTIRDRWKTNAFALEGQDRCGELLFVADLLNGHLLTFNASSLEHGPLDVLKLSTNSALHVRLYSQLGASVLGEASNSSACAAHRRGEKLFALVTTGLANRRQATTINGGLLAIEIDPMGRLQEVAGIFDGGIPRGTEGVLVTGRMAVVGGFRDTCVALVDLSGLTEPTSMGAHSLRVVQRLCDPAYVQLVGTLLGNPDGGNASDFALALWGQPGGIATFRRRHDEHGTTAVAEMGRYLSPALARANRVHLQWEHSPGEPRLVWLPLEQWPFGAVAAVDISNPYHLTIAIGPVALHIRDANNVSSRLLNTTSTCYCLVALGTRLYAFSAPSATLFVFHIQY